MKRSQELGIGRSLKASSRNHGIMRKDVSDGKSSRAVAVVVISLAMPKRPFG